MKKFLKHFKNQNEDRLNIQLIDRGYEDDIAQSVLEVFKSFETIPSIKFISYTIEYDESKINFAKYITSRKKKKKKDKHIKFIYIKPDRAFEITMKFRIAVKDQVKIIKKSILVPLFDGDKYVTLKGKRYFLLYQLVDSSTYVSKMGLTMKSLMPIVLMFRDKHTVMTDVDGNQHSFITYFMKVFRRDISVMIFFLCRMGFINTLRYFLLDQILELVEVGKEVHDDPEWYYFTINKNFSIRVNKYFFDKYDYVKAATGMITECFTPKTTLEQLENLSYWLEQLGSLYTTTKHKKIESGKSTMLFYERLLDVTTKKNLKVSMVNKLSIYSVDNTAA